MMATSVLGVVALLGVLMMIQPSNGQNVINCYSCTGTFSSTDTCNHVGSNTQEQICFNTNYCATTVYSTQNSITRGCGNATASNSGPGWVTYTCSGTNLCNTQSPAPRTATASLAMLIFSVFVVLALHKYA